MLCQKIKVTMKLSIFFILLLFCSVVFSSQSSYAIEDLVKTVESGTSVTANDKVFPDCNEACFSQYKYLIVEMSNLPSSPTPTSLSFRQNASYNYNFVQISMNYNSLLGSYQVFAIDSSFYALYYSRIPATFNYNVVYTLTDREPFGACPSCPPVPDCPPVPTNPYDNKLDEIRNAIYTVPAVLLTIYFFYCIYRMIIKGVK